MAVVQGFEFDIFISYAHKDNQPPHRWVDQFHDDLENWLKHRRGLSKLKIWRDPELDGATDFNLSIQNKIESSALFLALNSRNFLVSEYCKKEQDWFYNHNHVHHGGLLVGERRRIFNILLNNIPHAEWPDALGQTSGFHMHDASPGENDLGEFISHNNALYEERLRLIVDAVETILIEFSKTRKIKVKDAEETGGSIIVEGPNNTITIYPSHHEKRQEASKSDTGPDIGPNPYLGLGAFQERDADRFYGREALTEKLWRKFRVLNDPSTNKDAIRLLPILGPCGSGKSSLARAGLIPALARTPIPGGVGARVAVLTPGEKTA